ncbi:MAG: hypothetical protein ACXV7F_08525 [Methylomonas sp.]
MQRIYQRAENGFTNHLELNRQTAFHEAGHVAAIYLENKRKNLPPVFFEIHVNKPDSLTRPLSAKVNGGRLVGEPSIVIRENIASEGNSSAPDDYQRVYEADMINFLAGPLAEAKYVAIRDNEVFNINLLNPRALSHYGGSADLLEVMSYLECYLPSPERREAKLNALFNETFRFIQNHSNWKKITALAHHILNDAHSNISCYQAIEVLEASVKNSHIASRLQAAFV